MHRNLVCCRWPVRCPTVSDATIALATFELPRGHFITKRDDDNHNRVMNILTLLSHRLPVFPEPQAEPQPESEFEAPSQPSRLSQPESEPEPILPPEPVETEIEVEVEAEVEDEVEAQVEPLTESFPPPFASLPSPPPQSGFQHPPSPPDSFSPTSPLSACLSEFDLLPTPPQSSASDCASVSSHFWLPISDSAHRPASEPCVPPETTSVDLSCPPPPPPPSLLFFERIRISENAPGEQCDDDSASLSLEATEDTYKLQLSPFFRHLIDNVPSTDWLPLLRDQWMKQASFFEGGEIDIRLLQEELGRSRVQCLNGEEASLSETLLPRKQWMAGWQTALPFVDIAKGDDDSWSFLRVLGVVTEPSAQFCIDWLKHLRQNQTLDGYLPDQEISLLYAQLQDTEREDHDYIRQKFQDMPLIYVPDASQKWVDLDKCVWNGPHNLQYYTRLRETYPQNRKLFNEILGIEDATPTDVLQGASLLDIPSQMANCASMFETTNRLIVEKRLSRSEGLLEKYLNLFPVQHPNGLYSFHDASSQQAWFIADREDLRQAFEECVPLLAFSTDQVERMMPLIKYYGLQDRLLSTICHQTVVDRQAFQYDCLSTEDWRKKTSLLSCFIPETNPSKQKKITSLEQAEAYQSNALEIKWEFVYNKASYTSSAQKSPGVAVFEANRILIFLARDTVEKGVFPLRVARQLFEFSGLRDLDAMNLANLIFNQPSVDLSNIVHSARMPSVTLEQSTSIGSNALASLQTNDDGKPTAPAQLNSKAQCQVSFHGAVFVSNLLENLQGAAYDPNRHWTSPMRYLADHKPFQPSREPVASFDITRPSRALKRFIQNNSYNDPPHWIQNASRIYIDVETTVGDIESPFNLSPAKFLKFEQTSREGASQKALYVLIRFFSVQDRPQTVIIADPWTIYSTGQMKISMNNTEYEAKLCLTPRRRARGFACPRISPYQEYMYPKSVCNDVVRLIKLESDPENSATISGEIICVPLAALREGKYRYTALSYSWGSSLKPYMFRTPQGSIPLTTSLYFALMDARKHNDSTKMLWVDAICINQDDQQDKATQIKMLPDIFKLADGVLAWVGRGGQQNELAMDTLQAVSKSSSGCVHTARPNVGSSTGASESKCDVRQRDWTAVDRFIEQPWFQRTWAVQEVILARQVTLISGSGKLEWDEFCFAIQAFSSHERVSASKLDIRNTKAILDVNDYRIKYRLSDRKHPNLFALLEAFQNKATSLPQDKMFSLLAIAADGSKEAFQPDYNSRLPRIMRRYASEFVQQGYALDMLSRAGTDSEPKPDGLPSWIPNWTSSSYRGGIISSSPAAQYGSCATRGTTLSAAIHPKNNGILTIKGQLFDKIIKIGRSVPADLDEVFRAIEGTTVVAITSNGYTCLVPENAESGDEIALFNGGPVPFLLRRSIISNKHWLLGECYVHGMTQDDAFITIPSENIHLY